MYDVVVGALYPVTVSRSRYLFYCTINLGVVNVVPGTSALIMIGVVVFEVLIGLKLYRHNKAFKSLNRTGNGGPPLHLIVRVGIFSAYSVLAFIGCIAFWSSTGDTLPYVIQASLPTAAFLIFGTQAEILRAWGVTAVVAFLTRPFSRSPKEPPKAIHISFPTSNVKRQDTMDTIIIAPSILEKGIQVGENETV